MRVTWEEADLEVGRQVLDTDGAVYVICNIENVGDPLHVWTMFRGADSWIMPPRTAYQLVTTLNEGRFIPKGLR